MTGPRWGWLRLRARSLRQKLSGISRKLSAKASTRPPQLHAAHPPKGGQDAPLRGHRDADYL
jgi:hypothetical protein